MTTNTNVALLAALEAAHDAIIGMKVEAETAAQGDEQMMLEACEQISNEGLEATTAIRAALTTAAAVPPEGWVMVPREATDAMVQAAHHIDLSYMPGQEGADRAAIYRAMLAAAPKAEPVPAAGAHIQQESAYTSVQLAEMVLSDCGHSSNYKPLLERVAGRIDRHVERLLTVQQADRAMRKQAAPAVAAADVLEQIANEPPINGNNLAAARVMMAAQMLRDQITEAAAAPQPAVQQGDALPREDFAWLVVQEACETEPADEDDPECIRILRRDLKSAVLSAFLRHDAAHPAASVAPGDAEDAARSQAKEGA